MTISIIHPTRHRPHQALTTRHRWLSRADNTALIEYKFSVDTDDDTMPHTWGEVRGPNKTAIQAINRGAETAMGEQPDKEEQKGGGAHQQGFIGRPDLLIVVSDDFSEPPMHWDTLLRRELSGKSDFVLKTQDGIQKTLVTLPIVDRVWYERYGYVYHKGYEHLFCDTEMTAVAIMTGKYIKSDLVFPHLHYTTGKTAMDEINVKNDATNAQGQALFNERLKNNFGIESPVCAYESIQW